MKYVCEATVCNEECGGYSVFFDNIEGAITQGETLFEALTNAESAMAEIMVAYENFQAGIGEEMTNKIKPFDENAELDLETHPLTLIKVDTDEYRKNPSPDVEVWYSPNTKKYFTVLTDDNIEVKPCAESEIRRVSGVK